MYNNDNTFMQINKVFFKNVPFKKTKMIMIYDSIGKKGGDNVKTIQYYLKKCNRKEIINSYIYEYGFNYELMKEEYRNITFGQFIDKYTEELNKYIDKLISIEPKFDEETLILLTIHAYSRFNDNDIQHLLIKKSELLNETDLKNVGSYGYELTDFDEIVGFYVADTYLTQYEIDALLVDFLHESSYTGFNHEDLNKMQSKLEKTMKEIEENEKESKDELDFYNIVEEFLKQKEEELGYEFEKKDDSQEKAHNIFLKQLIDYNNTSKAIELQKLKELIG